MFLSRITLKFLLLDLSVLLIRNLNSSNPFYIHKRLVKQNIPTTASRLLVQSLKNWKGLNPFCWNRIQENLIKEDHQTLLSRNGRMITNLNSTGLPRTWTITVNGIILNLHQNFHTKDTHLKPIMEWWTIFKVSGDNMFNSTETIIILFNLFIVGTKRKTKTKFFLW